MCKVSYAKTFFNKKDFLLRKKLFLNYKLKTFFSKL